MTTVDFYYDFSSPNAYFSFVQLSEYVADTDHEVTWKPIFLGGIMRELETDPPVSDNELKARYLQRDLERWGERYDIPFSFPSTFPIMTVTPLRGALVVEERRPDHLSAYIDRVFRAYWVEDRDIGEADVLAELAEEVDLDGEALLEAAEDPEVKDALRDRNERALERGVFGAPTFFVDGEMYWGKDRFDFVREELEDPEA